MLLGKMAFTTTRCNNVALLLTALNIMLFLFGNLYNIKEEQSCGLLSKTQQENHHDDIFDSDALTARPISNSIIEANPLPMQDATRNSEMDSEMQKPPATEETENLKEQIATQLDHEEQQSKESRVENSHIFTGNLNNAEETTADEQLPVTVDTNNLNDSSDNSVTTCQQKPLENFAYVFFITNLEQKRDPREDERELKRNEYLRALRMQIHGLRHDPIVRSQYPIMVLVTESIPMWVRCLLMKDGALVKEVPHIRNPIQGEVSRWEDNYTKLAVFNLTEFQRVLYFDSDIFQWSNMDSAFTLGEHRYPLLLEPERARENKCSQICECKGYYFGAVSDVGSKHNYHSDRFNAGFFVVDPDADVYKEIVGLVHQHIPGRSTRDLEQGLLNWYFRSGGPCPSTYIPYEYNGMWMKSEHVWRVRNYHEKFWSVSSDRYIPSVMKLVDERKQKLREMDKVNGNGCYWDENESCGGNLCGESQLTNKLELDRPH